MERLPLEVLANILGRLPRSDRLSAALSCKTFLAALNGSLPQAVSITVHFAEKSTRAAIKGTGEASLTLCQCESHGSTLLLEQLLPHISAKVVHLNVEDELMAGERLRDSSLHSILEGCRDAPLSTLAVQHVDFTDVRPWTLALLASFNGLTEVFLESCRLDESLLLRAVSASADCLRHIVVTDSLLITDKLAAYLARSCPNLEFFDVRRCKKVTAFSLVSLMEARLRRRHQMLTVNMEETGFDAQQLEKCMASSLMPCGVEWRATRMQLELGRQRPALLLEHPSQTGILVHCSVY